MYIYTGILYKLLYTFVNHFALFDTGGCDFYSHACMKLHSLILDINLIEYIVLREVYAIRIYVYVM